MICSHEDFVLIHPDPGEDAAVCLNCGERITETRLVEPAEITLEVQDGTIGSVSTF